VLLYYITDRRQFPGNDGAQRRRLLDKIAEAVRAGVDFIQLREKDLTARELEKLAREAVAAVRAAPPSNTRLLINSRADVAIAAGAHGVHLRSDDSPAGDARAIFGKAGMSNPIIAVSCHSAAEVRLADSHGADFAVFAPVFEKVGGASVGLDKLREACASTPAVKTPEPSPSRRFSVLALGGVTLENAFVCIAAGAGGIAGIRLFQDNDIATVVAHLRRSG
jgi:thiamine-phosphate pyrophosphorylase